ncbi:AAA domain-containing protein [Deinococcus marmoris]|uniref:AAA domain-containing protein n=1 Tax=Deinococcus marmoris TaxID=249408 RepID=UPI000494FF05|nr:AAA domain-containing protein [Deinococcus marmoris]
MSIPQPQDPAQLDQARRFFQYLKEFTQLRSRPRRTNNGDTLLWLHALPEDQAIVNAARHGTGGVTDEWVTVHKPRFVPAPALPEELLAWVTGSPGNPQQLPTIRTQLVVETEVIDDDFETQRIQETLFLEDNATVQLAWLDYEARWQRWAQEEVRARAVQKVYSQLYDFHQKLSAFGETYELRLGLGYLAWKTPGGDEVRRHLLTARAALEFDVLRGVLRVVAAGDGARTALEQDMLDADDRASPQLQQAIEVALAEGGEDLWSGESLPPLLESWVNAAGAQGVYEDDLKPPRGVGGDPVVHWAPALILRKRGERSLTAAYEQLIGQVSLDNLPESTRRFMGQAPDESRMPNEPQTMDQTVYFPLPSNDEQRKIIHRIAREPGLLVQGPPGTGKSHTIVNLVSHLLATDQKVLVTSHTARALKVLRDKFPAELLPLCVTHLRGEEGAQAALQGSVAELLHRSTSRQPDQEQRHEEALHSALEKAKQAEKVQVDRLQHIREAETGTLNLHSFVGTGQQIGEQLRRQEADVDWLHGLIDLDQAAPLTDAQALRLLFLWRELGDEETRQLTLLRPDMADLPSPDFFLHLLQAEQEAKRQFNAHGQARGDAAYPALLAATSSERGALLTALLALGAGVETECRRPLPWLPGAVDALLSGQMGRWQDVQARSEQILPELLQRVGWLEAASLSGTEGHDPEALRHDAQTMFDHLQAGGGWGNFVIRPTAVRNRQYLRESVRVGGRAADTPDALRDLLDVLRLRVRLRQLTELWASQGVTVSGPLPLQVAELGEQCQALARLTELGTLLNAAQMAVRAVPGLPEPRWWEPEERAALAAATHAADATHEAYTRQEALDVVLPGLDGLSVTGRTHEVVGQLVQAVQARDAAAYGEAYRRADRLAVRQALWTERHALDAQLRTASAPLAGELARSATDPSWDGWLGALGAAWNWQRADADLSLLADPEAEHKAREKLASCRQAQRRTLGELAAARAWRSTLDRLTHEEQTALVGWQKALKMIGKGTGKNAGKFIKIAQQELEIARTAIPAWIMPLHLVAENFSVQRGMFDVVIIDEASQAGPEALFLTFIAKKIIIVGDDKQIPPDGVGISIEQLDALVARYLYDFPRPHVIGHPKASLFDFGESCYPKRVGLREHFRCMPEIIKFSSDLSYSNQPLFALRQFGADRLQPLVARHVEDGFTMRVSRDPVNRPEGRAIVDQIKACIANPRYAGKSFGVISLVGDSQAEEIASLLLSEVSEAELEARRLVCGNAYSFQGDERDVIFLSMVVSPGDGGLAKVPRDSAIFQPRYNVAVSRARDQLWLFHSADLSDLHPEDIRVSLIQHVRNPDLGGWQPLRMDALNTLRELAGRRGRSNNPAPQPFDSWFELDVYLNIVDRGYRVIPQHELNGYHIDLVVEGQRGRLAVECDGDRWHGPDQFRADLARQQTLERAGMVFWRVRGSTYTRDPEAALDSLWAALDRRGVFPEGDPRNYAPLENAPLPVSTPEVIEGEKSTADAAERAESAAQDEVEDTASEALPMVSVLDTAWLRPYASWTPHSLPDPQSLNSLDAVVDGLYEIVDAEGPMTCRQAYQTYCQAAGVRFGSGTKSLLNKAMARAQREGVLILADEWGKPGLVDKIVRVPGDAEVVPRQAGPRRFVEVPPSELAAAMRELSELQSGDRELLYRAVLSVYGAQRLTGNAREVLDLAYGFFKQTSPVSDVLDPSRLI